MIPEISSTIKIRFIDCDPIGHLNNSKYLDYMLNAREDHVEKYYGFTYEQHTKETGCTWITIQNEIAYLKEVRYNNIVKISSKVIDIQEKTAKVEIIMQDSNSEKVNAVLWCTVIYFNMKTRKSEPQSEKLKELFQKFYINLEQKDFQSRVNFIRNEYGRKLIANANHDMRIT